MAATPDREQADRLRAAEACLCWPPNVGVGMGSGHISCRTYASTLAIVPVSKINGTELKEIRRLLVVVVKGKGEYVPNSRTSNQVTDDQAKKKDTMDHCS